MHMQPPLRISWVIEDKVRQGNKEIVDWKSRLRENLKIEKNLEKFVCAVQLLHLQDGLDGTNARRKSCGDIVEQNGRRTLLFEVTFN